jgi:hypothetical protein
MRLAAADSGRRSGARRELAGELAGDGQTGLPCTRLRGKKTKIKRRTWGTYKEAWRGARGAGRGDRRRAAELRDLLGAAALRVQGREEERRG